MTDTLPIPREAVEAMVDKLKVYFGAYPREVIAEIADDALRAALKAWPGMHAGWQCIGCGDDKQIILPLPQEARDE